MRHALDDLCMGRVPSGHVGRNLNHRPLLRSVIYRGKAPPDVRMAWWRVAALLLVAACPYRCNDDAEALLHEAHRELEQLAERLNVPSELPTVVRNPAQCACEICTAW